MIRLFDVGMRLETHDRWGEELGAPRMLFHIELIRAGFEPFRARGIPKSIVRTKDGCRIRSMMSRPRRGSKPARANDRANHATRRAEFFALPFTSHLHPLPLLCAFNSG
jgi:hypothetical protein